MDRRCGLAVEAVSGEPEMPELTKTEATELAQHERTIVAGLNTFRDVGTPLLAICEGGLYRAAHKNFEGY
jgi:hypothetical protein